jgi:outer membrane protein assembly factor BamB
MSVGSRVEVHGKADVGRYGVSDPFFAQSICGLPVMQSPAQGTRVPMNTGQSKKTERSANIGVDSVLPFTFSDKWRAQAADSLCPTNSLSIRSRLRVPQNYQSITRSGSSSVSRQRINLLTAAGFVVVAATTMVLAWQIGFLSARRGAQDRPPIETITDAPAGVVAGEQTIVGAPSDHEFLASTNSKPDRWNRFRGPNGTGISNDSSIPLTWSESQNLQWKCRLPGPGSSSPIVNDRYVFLTTYTGYGVDSNFGDIRRLERQVVAVDRETGTIAWSKSFPAVQPEDPYEGMGVPEHGYATNSAVVDDQRLYAFLGKSGVYAFDMEGNVLWNHSVGTDSSNRRWGSAASLMLYKDLLIVNASEESRCLVALDRESGDQVWSAAAESLELAYGTPAIAKVSPERDDLVIAVPGEIWGLNPLTGKLYWFAETSLTGNLSPSLIVDGDKIYCFGGYRSSGSVALLAGGRGDVSSSNVLWTSRQSSYVATPVLFDNQLFWIDDTGLYHVMDAETGESLLKTRVPGLDSRGRPVYASPIVVNDKIYIQTRQSGLFVMAPKPALEVLSQNQFADDTSIFNGTPAVDAGQLFIRSYEYLYCVSSM